MITMCVMFAPSGSIRSGMPRTERRSRSSVRPAPVARLCLGPEPDHRTAAFFCQESVFRYARAMTSLGRNDVARARGARRAGASQALPRRRRSRIAAQPRRRGSGRRHPPQHRGRPSRPTRRGRCAHRRVSPPAPAAPAPARAARPSSTVRHPAICWRACPNATTSWPVSCWPRRPSAPTATG